MMKFLKDERDDEGSFSISEVDHFDSNRTNGKNFSVVTSRSLYSNELNEEIDRSV